MSLKIGGGAEYNISEGTKLSVGLTWNNGFIDVLKTDDYKANNQAVELSVGVFF